MLRFWSFIGFQGRRIRLRVSPAEGYAVADIAASQIISEGEVHHDEKPNDTRAHKNPGQRFFITAMHEEQDDQRHFGDGDDEGGDVVERAEVDIGQSPGQQKQGQEREPDQDVAFF